MNYYGEGYGLIEFGWGGNGDTVPPMRPMRDESMRSNCLIIIIKRETGNKIVLFFIF